MNYILGLMPSMFEGLRMTLLVFALTLILSVPLGVIVALARLSRIKALESLARGYIYVLRGSPLLLQIVFIFFGLPAAGIALNRFAAVMLAFVLNYGAYFGEIFRAGIQSIGRGQYESAEVLGLSRWRTFTRIILPQAVKRILPPAGNEVITLVKDTSLVYVVGLGELLREGKIASNRDASLVPLVLVAIIYLGLTAVLSLGLKIAEERYAYYD